MTPRGATLLAAAFAVAFAPGGAARAAQGEGGASLTAPAGSVRVENAPAEMREVVGVGRAAISPATGGKIGAVRAATALALRDAVEKALGIYVSGRSVTHNYQMLRDQVLTRAEGYATLREVLEEKVGADGSVTVRVRADVSMKPLAERLRALNVTRGLRVHVAAYGKPKATAATQAAADRLRAHLAAAGFATVERHGDADLSVRVWGGYTPVQRTALETAAGPMTMHSMKGDLSVYVAWPTSAEAITSLYAADTAMHIDEQTACREAAGDAAEAVAPRLTDALMVLCARLSQPVQLHVANVGSATRVAKLEEALMGVPGVQGVKRRGYQGRAATWELDVVSDAVPLIARALEQGAALKSFRLAVDSETRTRITASAR